MIDQIVTAYQAIPAGVLPLIFGAIGLSAFQQRIKNWLELEDPKVLVFLTTTFALAAAVIPAALGYLSANPAVLGEHTALVFTAMTLSYRYVIQPGSSKLASFNQDRVNYKAYKARVAAVSDGVQPPAGGVPSSAIPRLNPETPTQNTNEFNG